MHEENTCGTLVLCSIGEEVSWYGKNYERVTMVTDSTKKEDTLLVEKKVFDSLSRGADIDTIVHVCGRVQAFCSGREEMKFFFLY